MESALNIHVGTSGCQYDHWRGAFYPEALPRSEFLDYYADHFPTLELNQTFYQLPQGKQLARMREAVPDSFVFSVKANRYITYIKKLKDARLVMPPFLRRMEVLGDKLGPILFQLPPQWRFNLMRLESFLKGLPSGYRYVFEFRDPSWFHESTYAMLTSHNAALCIYQVGSRTSPQVVTADFIYIRLHGRTGEDFDGNLLTEWAGTLSRLAGEGKEIFCYFDNGDSGCAARDAGRLKRLIEKTLERKSREAGIPSGKGTIKK
ncbi:MAG: DUF72 domain-containing protein [Syntrophales bacterium]